MGTRTPKTEYKQKQMHATIFQMNKLTMLKGGKELLNKPEINFNKLLK